MSENFLSKAVRRNLYGRRNGRKLSETRSALMNTQMAAFSVPGYAPSGDSKRAPINLETLFPQAQGVWVEIGFGGGEHVAHLARSNPDKGIIGCEHFVEGVSKLLRQADLEGLQNLKIASGDARDLLDLLPEHSIERVYLLYPDPWPKLRHRKRRFVNPENLNALARILKPSGELRIASDIPEYIDWSLKQLAAHSEFVCMNAHHGEGTYSRSQAWPNWISTRYEQKALREGRAPCYLRFERELEIK